MGTPSVNEWADFMPQTVSIEPWASYKSGGADSNFGTAVVYACRIEMKNHLIAGNNGQMITAKGRVFLLSNSVINIKDRVTLPAGYLPTTPILLDVNVVDDETGNHHTTLEF